MTDAELACIEALKWYADHRNYFASPGQGNTALVDGGKRAREALRGLQPARYQWREALQELAED